ncbi:hypothetical protein BURMUCGD1_4503 [Burkholderia multivorans CGD1]|nr:hypothetical protein BURMUCGD1_4503 [Burkholderia multivorans CGD1]
MKLTGTGRAGGSRVEHRACRRTTRGAASAAGAACAVRAR